MRSDKALLIPHAHHILSRRSYKNVGPPHALVGPDPFGLSGAKLCRLIADIAQGWLLVRICIADAHGLATFSHMKKIQSAAIPFRLDEANRLSLLLITSRRKGRWVLPKGTVSGMLPNASAAREAFEEAGVIGSIAETPFETYYLRRKVGYGAAIEIPVHAFPMRVTVELQTWPEMDFRQRQWILAGQITEMVESEELRSLLKRFAQSDQAGLKARMDWPSPIR